MKARGDMVFPSCFGGNKRFLSDFFAEICQDLPILGNLPNFAIGPKICGRKLPFAAAKNADDRFTMYTAFMEVSCNCKIVCFM